MSSQSRSCQTLTVGILVGFLFSGCTTDPAKKSTDVAEISAPAPPSPPEIPEVSESAEKLEISAKFFEIDFDGDSPFHDGQGQEKTQILSPDDGFEFFHPQKLGLDLLSAPWVVVNRGEEARIEIGSEFIYPTSMTTDLETGQPIPETFETTTTGVTLSLSVEPTGDPEFLKVKLDPKIREFVEFLPSEDDPNLEEPQFRTLGKSYAGRFRNGSYLLVGTKSDIQTVEDKVPILGDIPLLGKAFRTKTELEIQRLVAVQMIISERKLN